MTEAALAYIDNRMTEIGIPYAFAEWKGDAATETTRYFVGYYNELESLTLDENGHQETVFELRGFTRGSWSLLEADKALIEKNLPETTILEDGTGIAITYGYGMIVPTGVSDLKSIKINLSVQEWRAK